MFRMCAGALLLLVLSLSLSFLFLKRVLFPRKLFTRKKYPRISITYSLCQWLLKDGEKGIEKYLRNYV